MSRALRLVATATALLALAPALAACGNDAGQVHAGDVLPARDDAQFADGAPSVVALPIGRLEVFLGDPSTRLAAEDTRQREVIDAPEGTTFVAITWQYDAGTFDDLRPYIGPEKSPTVELVADKARYRLPAPEPTGRGSESFYVPVTGSGEEPSLRVEYDGVTQTVDLTTGERDEGAAAPLYDIKPTKRTRSCTGSADFHGSQGRSDFQCKVTRPLRLPYADGKWAEDGHAFLAVTVDTTVRRFDILGRDLRSGGTYLATGVESTFTYGKDDPVQAVQQVTDLCPDRDRSGCTGRYYVVFDVTDQRKRRLEIDQTFKLQLASQWGAFDRNQQLELHVTSGLRIG